jgi:hypothetical protein
MKKYFSIIVLSLATLLFDASAFGQYDLTMKPGVYFPGSKLTIDQTKDKFVSKGMRIDVFGDQAIRFEDGYYVFHMGIIALRSGTTVPNYMMTFGVFSTKGGTSGNEINFQPGRTSGTLVVPVKVKSGANRVEFAIDPYQKKIESNETNNTLWINVVVNQRFPTSGIK